MMGSIVKPKIDVAFKKMFTDKDNRELLKSFISDILDINKASVKEMVILNSEITPDEIDGKFTRFDIFMTVDDIVVNIEIQISNEGDFRDRSVYYWAQNYSGQLKKGEPYSRIKPTISINIIDFSLFSTQDYHSVFTLYDKEHEELLTNKCEMHFFELSKIDNTPDTKDRKKLWMQLINAESEDDLEMLAQTQIPEIIDGVNVVRRFSADDKMRYIAMTREKALRDEISAMHNARESGRKEGREEGRKEGREEGRKEGRKEGRNEILEALAAKYRKMGMSDEETARLLALD